MFKGTVSRNDVWCGSWKIFYENIPLMSLVLVHCRILQSESSYKFDWHFPPQPPVYASITEQQAKEEKVRVQSARFCQGAACRGQDPTSALCCTQRGIKDDWHNSSISICAGSQRVLVTWRCSREYRMIYLGPGFLVVVWLGPSITPSPTSRQQVVFFYLSLPVCRRSSWRERGLKGCGLCSVPRQMSTAHRRGNILEWGPRFFPSSYPLPPFPLAGAALYLLR